MVKSISVLLFTQSICCYCQIRSNVYYNCSCFQTEISMSMSVPTPGRYYLILLYHSDVDMRVQELDVASGPNARGKLHLATCPYRSAARICS